MYYTNFNDLRIELDKLNDGERFFRGYTENDELTPLICRASFRKKKEDAILEKFEKQFKIYTGVHTYLDFLSVAQHYGLATRLLDFTTNPYVALSFATGRKVHGKFNICYIAKFETKDITKEFINSPWVINNDILIMSDNPSETPFTDNLLRIFRKSSGEICCIKPDYSSQRMMMQDGVFVVSDIDNIASWKVLFNSKLVKIECDFDEREMRRTREYLETVHCDLYRLMPDLTGLCNAINNDILIK